MTMGLEVHVQLNTKSKMFCGCSTKFGAPPNTQVCPVCLGMPGVLPVMNRRAFELAVKTALALNCTVARFTRFDRKSYYYPDLPKNYQISQYDLPLSHDGWLEIETPAGKKKIGIIRVHLEEDAGKLLHAQAGFSSVDLNRAGIPLMEIVSRPDIRSIDELRAYVNRLKLLLVYLEVSNCNMEEGNIRVDANISVQTDRDGSELSSPISEIKNMNSFSACEKAMEYESGRLCRRLREGVTMGAHPKETRGWDDERGVTVGQRQKEEASDYRYFPDPDLAPVVVDDRWLEKIRSEIPELPEARRERFIEQYALGEYDAGVLVADRALADYFEELVRETKDVRSSRVWVTQHVLRELNNRALNIREFTLTPKRLADLIRLVADKSISITAAQERVLPDMIASGKSADEIVREKALGQVSDASSLEAAADAVIRKFPKEVEQFRSGKEGLINFLIGMVMKETKGKANPQVVTELLRKKLS
jgi:aspartyl-tRNA(Asn)/glutamyl-tRNA(Gln) amidotransferase subunit B